MTPARRQINLGRTSLASVDASSVNGSRSLENPFYGVRNAFDDGANWVNGIQYSHWLSSSEAEPWIEVRFDVPVTVAQVDVDTSLPAGFSLRLELEHGGERELHASARPEREPDVRDAEDGDTTALGAALPLSHAQSLGGVASLVLDPPQSDVRALTAAVPRCLAARLRGARASVPSPK